MKIDCRVCLRKNLSIFLHPKNMRSSQKEPFFYCQCTFCHSLSIKNIPENLSSYYENYYSFLPIREENFLKKIGRKCFFSKKNWISSIFSKMFQEPDDLAMKSLRNCNIHKKTSILDIGCGSGNVVYQLFEAGFHKVLGIDAFLDKDTVLPNGAKIYKRDIFEEKNTWDVVMLHHVFEHMLDPHTVLLQLHNITAPNGTIVIRVPNVDSYAYKIFQENWFGIQAPIHIFLPSIQGMYKMVDETGWEVKKIVGENLLKFWEYNLAYASDIGHQDTLGQQIFSHPTVRKNLIFKKEYKYWKKKNRFILKQPELCDWLVYYLRRKDEI